jgi:hypothetical protein
MPEPAIPPKPVCGAPTGIAELPAGVVPAADVARGLEEERADELSFAREPGVIEPLESGVDWLSLGTDSPPAESDGSALAGATTFGTAVLTGNVESGEIN